MLNLYFEDEAAARRVWKILRIAAGGLVVLAVIGFGVGPRLYRHYQEQRLAALARHFLQAGQYPNALFSARLALALDRTNLAACEVVAELAERANSPEALAWRQRVADLAPTFDNRIRLAACALTQEAPPYPVTKQVLDEMSEADRRRVPYHLIASRLALQLHRVPEAVFHLTEALRLEPTNDLYRVPLAQLQLESTNAAVAAAGRDTLERLRNNPRCRLAALRSLVAAHLGRRQDWPAARRYSEELLALPESGFDDRMTHLSILLQTQRADFQPFLSALQQACATNAVQAGQLALWLAGNRTPAEAAGWLGQLPDPLQTQPPVALALALCLAEGKQWSELQARLRDQTWRENEYLRLAFLALASRQRNEAAAAQEYWQAAVRQASERMESLYTLARVVQGWNWKPEARELLWLALARFPRATWARAALERGCYAAGDTRGLYRLYSLLWKANPSNATTKNNLAAVALLLRTNLHQANQLAREVYAADKSNASFVGTYTYSLHLQGKTSAALKLCEQLPPQELQRPSTAVYYGVLLAAAGETEKAKQYLALAETAPLLPEEKTLLIQAKQLLAGPRSAERLVNARPGAL